MIAAIATLVLCIVASPGKDLEMAIVGRNLLDDHYPEFAPIFAGTQKSEVERSICETVVWRC